MPPVDTVAPPSAGGLTRAARGLTEVFAPAVLAAALPIVIGVHAGRTVLTGLAWGLLASVFSAIIPYAVIWYGVRRGRLSDRHIGVREQRTKPLTLGLLSVLVGLALLGLLGAPRELTALVVALFVGGLVAAVWWSRVRLRDHTTWQVVAGTVIGAAVTSIVFGLLR